MRDIGWFKALTSKPVPEIVLDQSDDDRNRMNYTVSAPWGVEAIVTFFLLYKEQGYTCTGVISQAYCRN